MTIPCVKPLGITGDAMESKLLEHICSPQDLQGLSHAQLKELAGEIRRYITGVVGDNGGHLASNLGVVEATLALHRVFDFSHDRLVFDVGHQCYTHKIITGRREEFRSLRTGGGLSGFPNPRESTYDTFICGHATTGISSAAGLSAAARIKGEKRKVVALVGDGSIGGGMCFEAMNQAGHRGEDLLIVLNDNEMAIGKTVGAFARRLEEFRSRPEATQFRRELRQIFHSIPLIGDSLDWLQERLLDALKNHTGAAAIFEALGFRYFGPFDGHNIPVMEEALHNLRKLDGPRILHLITEKGRGFPAAAQDPESFHSASPFTIAPGGKVTTRSTAAPSYSSVFAASLLKAARRDERVVALTAAMTTGTGLQRIAAELPERFFDVGIAEPHAVTFAGALAAAGLRPVVAIYSTFLQRGYDQIFHDIALQPHAPVIFALDRAGLVGQDGPTHHGIFDIAYLRHIPNMVLLAPRDGRELEAMLDFSLSIEQPAAIRYPRGAPPADALAGGLPAPLELGRGERLRSGGGGTIVAYGSMVATALTAAGLLAAQGVEVGVVNARFAKPLDGELLRECAAIGPLLTLEDHALSGGFGSAVCEFLADAGIACRIVRLGIPDEFVRAAAPEEQYRQLGLDARGVADSFLSVVRGG